MKPLYNMGTALPPDAIGYQMKTQVPSIAHLFLTYWSSGPVNSPQHYQLLLSLMVTLQNWMARHINDVKTSLDMEK